MKKLLLIPLLMIAAQAFAGTCPAGSNYVQTATFPLTLATLASKGVTSCFFVSAGGADTNTGVDEAHSWAHAPGMVGCSNTCGSHTPAAGEGFILKGGDSWTNASLPWHVTTSGSNGSPIYYGVDTTWFTGGAFAKPKLDPNYACCTDAQHAILWLDHVGHLIIDDIEITREVQLGPTGNAWASYLNGSTTGDVVWERMFVHSFDHCTGNGTPYAACTTNIAQNVQSSGIFADAFNGINATGVIIQFSEISDAEHSANQGICAGNEDQFIGNNCHDIGSGCQHGCRIAHDNQFNNMGQSFDSCANHQNVLYLDNFGGGTPASSFSSYVYNNLITNTSSCAAGAVLYPNPGTSGATSTVEYWIYNNVIWSSTAAADVIDPFGMPGGLVAKIHDWNNTYGEPGGSVFCVTVTGRAGVTIDTLDVQNLHCITPQGSFLSVGGGTTITNNTSNNVIRQTAAVATGQGYKTSNNYAPTLGSNSTVQAGANLSAQCAGSLTALCTGTTLGNTTTGNARGTTFDAGAYQFFLTATTPSCSPASGSSSTSITVTCTNPNGGTTVQGCTTDGSTPTTNGAGTAMTNGTIAAPTVTINATVSTLKCVAGTSLLPDSPVVTYGAYIISGGSNSGTTMSGGFMWSNGAVIK